MLGKPVTLAATMRARSALTGLPQGDVLFLADSPDPARGRVLGTGHLVQDAHDSLAATATVTTTDLTRDTDVYAVYQPAADSVFVPPRRMPSCGRRLSSA